MKQWFANVWMAVHTVLSGMGVTLRMLMRTYRRGAATQAFEYPEVPVPVKARYRGFHRFDLTTCIGCDKCAVACPVDCIYIDKAKSPVGKGFRVDGFVIDYSKCMFCALCVDPCPVDCIFMGANYDLSCYSRDGCSVDYARLPLEIAWGRATLNPTAVAESKRLSEPVWVKGEPNPFEGEPNPFEGEPNPVESAESGESGTKAAAV
jgi:NADH-quinone oxidoreductase subunit I